MTQPRITKALAVGLMLYMVLGIVTSGVLATGTFGDTTASASYSTSIHNIIFGTKFTMAAVSGQEAVSVTAYLKSSSDTITANVNFALYDSSGNLVGQATNTSMSLTTSYAWYTITISSVTPLTSGAQYYIVAWSDTQYAVIGTDSYPGVNLYSDAVTYNAYFPSSATFTTAYTDREAVIYCTYNTMTLYPSNVGVDTTVGGATAKFTCTWTDSVSLTGGGTIFSTDQGTGVWLNETWAAYPTASPASVNYNYTLPSSANIVVHYKWYANDSAHTWAQSQVYSLTTTYANSYPIEVLLDDMAGTLTNPRVQAWYSYNNGTIVMLSDVPFVDDVATINLVFGTPYLLRVISDQGAWDQQSYTPAYGDVITTVTVDYIPINATTANAPIVWSATQALDVLNVTGTLPDAADVVVTIYNQSLILIDTHTETAVSGFTYLYACDSNYSYSVKVEMSGYSEARIVGANPVSGGGLVLPLLWDIDPTIFCGAIITAFAFLFTPRNKGIGAVVTVGMACLFVYLGWWVIPPVVVSAFFVLAVFYAATQREEQG